MPTKPHQTATNVYRLLALGVVPTLAGVYAGVVWVGVALSTAFAVLLTFGLLVSYGVVHGVRLAWLEQRGAPQSRDLTAFTVAAFACFAFFSGLLLASWIDPIVATQDAALVWAAALETVMLLAAAALLVRSGRLSLRSARSWGSAGFWAAVLGYVVNWFADSKALLAAVSALGALSFSLLTQHLLGRLDTGVDDDPGIDVIPVYVQALLAFCCTLSMMSLRAQMIGWG